MKEEGKKPNFKHSAWKKISRKKWFYPAVYLTLVAFVLAGVLWYQNRSVDLPDENQTANNETQDNSMVSNPLYNNNNEDEATPVMEQSEMIQMPVKHADDTEIVTKFYDYNASEEEQEQALILYNNKYYQSMGIDIASQNDEPFDVTASLSGKVTEVKEDPLYGNVVEITHDYGVTTKYASLGEVMVEKGANVQQGDVIGTAGRNLYGQANGIHVHFELRKDNEPLNPEEYFNKPVSEIKPSTDEEDQAEENESQEESDNKVTNDETESSISMENT
ncbi:stage II sporulation protein Q [Melghiribacillus thermohalophilus]|uniref:Stage II sporulation protein Q n=1 Tax=Melghiribacillus thermohalophilus TaxID=1324956 RepID=A0A4R3NC70_9BACI|nr:M23 family metallopeptidase [Melghiribacillus thermohalophilus]TCT26428.1 stage II sporulation protein Q [Melghiribacillus thermohalophilus]